MEILIISGLSGGGKSRAASFLEDMGFYIVDNIPAGLIMKFAEFCAAGSNRYSRVALVYDVRTGESLDEFLDVLSALRAREYVCRLLFLEADVAAIIHRYKETRRLHPLLVRHHLEPGTVSADRSETLPPGADIEHRGRAAYHHGGYH